MNQRFQSKVGAWGSLAYFTLRFGSSFPYNQGWLVEKTELFERQMDQHMHPHA
jgi:hypothetical protein